MNGYRFLNTEGAPAVVVFARTRDAAWRKLYRTHAFYFHRTGWKLGRWP